MASASSIAANAATQPPLPSRSHTTSEPTASLAYPISTEREYRHGLHRRQDGFITVESTVTTVDASGNTILSTITNVLPTVTSSVTRTSDASAQPTTRVVTHVTTIPGTTIAGGTNVALTVITTRETRLITYEPYTWYQTVYLYTTHGSATRIQSTGTFAQETVLAITVAPTGNAQEQFGSLTRSIVNHAEPITAPLNQASAFGLGSKQGGQLSTGAKAGIGVGAGVAAVAAIALLVYILLRRRRNVKLGRDGGESSAERKERSELDAVANARHEKEGTGIVEEAGSNALYEMPSKPGELEAKRISRYELEGDEALPRTSTELERQ
jgi:hypothetical protein